MTATLPPVTVTDAPVSLPDGLRLPPLSQRFTAGGVAYYRSAAIPLCLDREFKPVWLKNKSAFLARGFSIKQDNGRWILQQWLSGRPGGYTLTPIGAEMLASAQAPRQELLPIETAPEEFTLPELPNGLEAKLYPYQRQPSRQLFRALANGKTEWGYPGADDLSDLGVGKTAMDLAAALATGRKPVVLCPVVGRGGWEWMFNHFGAEPHYIGTYEGLRTGNRPRIAEERDGRFYWKNKDDIILIMDEAQAVRHDDTINFRLCAGAIQQGIPIICASATIALSPLEFRFAGRITGLHQGADDWERFLMRHGCARPRAGAAYKWDGKLSHLVAINAQLFPRRGCRVRKEDLGEDCPETIIEVLPIDCTESARLEDMWREAQNTLERLAAQGVNRLFLEGRRRAMYMKCWQESELAIMPHVAARAREDVRAGNSVAIFMGFTGSRLAMCRALNTTAGFYGGMKQDRRQYWVREFQANRQHILISQVKAGGASVSLHDTTGDRPRITYIFPHNDPVAVQQATGRVDRVGSKSVSRQFIPCVRGPFTAKMVANMRRKMLAIATLNDGAGQRARF